MNCLTVPWENFLRDIVIESLFIWGVLLMYSSRIIYLYNRKLRKGISSHITALQSIAQNNLDVHLEDFSNDEFATIGNEVNSMISRLKEGVKVKESVNKLTSPAIAKK